MSEVLVGVIVGGLIVAIVPLVTLYYQNLQWNKEKKVEHLRLKRDRLEKLYERLSKQVEKGLMEGKWESGILALMYVHASEHVKTVFDKHLENLKGKERGESEAVFFNKAFVEVTAAMEAHLSQIDDEIEKTLF